MMDGVVDSILGIEAECNDEEDVEIDREILIRKGIEPGSERHKRLVYEETFNRDFQKKRYAEDEETELKPDWSSDP